MRKIVTILLVLFCIFANSYSVLAQTTADNSIINKSNLNSGLVLVKYSSPTNAALKLMIEKDSVRYTYDINNDEKYAGFPLQMGSGSYKISVLSKGAGNEYAVAYSETITANIKNDRLPYLNSIQMINWNEASEAVKKAKALTNGLKTEEDKVKAIYSYLVEKLSYDYSKASNVPAKYLPNVDDTLKTGTGICYDYSATFAAMLRSAGIPTKLIMGNSDTSKGYHAWNEVYLAGSNKWVTIDTTYDAQAKNIVEVSMIKESGTYKKAKEY